MEYQPTSEVSMPQQYRARDYYVYEIDIAAIGAGVSSSGSFAVQADSDFLWNKSAFFADIAGAAQTDDSRVIPLVSILVTDTGSGRQLSSSAVPLSSIFGTGGTPFILPRQRLFMARSIVNVAVTNFSSATTYNLKLSFIGEKGFR